MNQEFSKNSIFLVAGQMRLSQNLNDALNAQVAHEMRNCLAYKVIESYFERIQLKKIARYFHDQAQHEKEHADMFIKHINDRTGGTFVADQIETPIVSLDNAQSIGDAYVGFEELTTESIEEIYDLAMAEKSYVDLPFLQSMLNEQVEEEDSASRFRANIGMVTDMVLYDATFGD
jgi:ferritin